MQSSIEFRGTMDLFQHRYFRFNKVLMESIGEWPYQNIRVRFGIIAVIFVLGFSLLVPQVITIVKHLDDWDFMMECAVPLFFVGFVFTKGLNSLLNSPKMLKLVCRMRTDWEIWARDRDVNILHEYAEQGRKLTILHAFCSGATCIFFTIQPIIPKVIDVLLKNGTKPGQFPISVDYYYIDMQKYYFYIVLHCFVYTFVGFLIVLACDGMLIVYVQHSCGLFAVLGRKLERIGKKEVSAEKGIIAYGLDKPIMAFENLTFCINKHNHAIEYAELVDATYSWSFFFIVGLNMILISVLGIQIITKTNETEAIAKFVFCTGIAILHLYIESYLAQILMDHSINIRYYILNGKWYRLPLKAQKLLPLMMMRCNVPCKLTAKKIAILSVETFAGILKTSLTYFTVLRSAY